MNWVLVAGAAWNQVSLTFANLDNIRDILVDEIVKFNHALLVHHYFFAWVLDLLGCDSGLHLRDYFLVFL